MKAKIFGTDGVRGFFGGAIMNPEFARRLGCVAARWLWESSSIARPPIVLIGRDTRFSGPILQAAIAEGLSEAGVNVVLMGVLPSPALAANVLERKAAAGVMITASHNPSTDNGIKLFSSRGIKLSPEEEGRVEQELSTGGHFDLPAGISAGAIFNDGDGLDAYVERMARILAPGALRGWSIVFDGAHGAAAVSSSRVFRRLEAALHLIGVEPDGRNINRDVGSEHPEVMAERVRETGAVLGIAHDGDGDRVVLCDESGAVLDGDEVMALLALHALEHGNLNKGTLVATIQSNSGLDATMAGAGGRVVRTPVGDRHVVQEMLANGFNLGGESSGHIVFSDISPTGDGLLAALKAIEVMLETGKPLSALRRQLQKYPQVTGDLLVESKRDLESLPSLGPLLREAEQFFDGRGRILVRYSGTEPKLRLLVEGDDPAVINGWLNKLKEAARLDLPAKMSYK